MNHWSDTLDLAKGIVAKKMREEKLVVYLTIALMVCGIIAYLVSFAQVVEPRSEVYQETPEPDEDELTVAYAIGKAHGLAQAYDLLCRNIAPKEMSNA